MPGRRCLIIAHRGASADAPENTRAAILKAVQDGAHMIELDVQLTRDGRLVIFHDERLERTTNGKGRLKDWRYRELRRLDCGSWFSPRFSQERILLVSQALRLLPKSVMVNLELKATERPSGLVRRLRRCLRWTRTMRRSLLSSFAPDLLRPFASSRIPRALLCTRAPERAIQTARHLGCVALHPVKSLVTPALIRRAHTRGLRVHVWTVDDPKEARRLRRMGVDGVTTNHPAQLAKAFS